MFSIDSLEFEISYLKFQIGSGYADFGLIENTTTQ